MNLINPKNVLCSISGIREGALAIEYFKDFSQNQIFDNSLNYLAFKRGDLANNYKRYYDFLKPIFGLKGSQGTCRIQKFDHQEYPK